MKTKLILLIIIMSFFNLLIAQNKTSSLYSMKKANQISQETLKKLVQTNKKKFSVKYSRNSIYNINPVYTDNMIVDQNIVQVPGGSPNQILNESWAWGHFVDQYQNPSPLFGDLQNALFLPYNNYSSMDLPRKNKHIVKPQNLNFQNSQVTNNLTLSVS